MSRPCPSTLRAVRWAQLSLIKRQVEKLQSVVEGLPTIADCTDPDKAPDDEELGDHYVELRERVDLMLRMMRAVHFRTCGRFAYELRTFCKGKDQP